MARTRRGGKRLRAGSGRTRKQDCCCSEPVTCSNVNDTTWRSAREVSVEVFGLTIGSGCSGACATVPTSGVLPYSLGIGGSGCSMDWGLTASLGCVSCGGDIKFTCRYNFIAEIRCFTLTNNVRIRIFNSVSGGAFNCGSPTARAWDITWEVEIPIADFFLGTEYTAAFVLRQDGASIICNPTGHATSYCKVVVN